MYSSLIVLYNVNALLIFHL